MPQLPLVLAFHVSCAVALFLPSLLLPFVLRTDRAALESDSRIVRVLVSTQRLAIPIGLAVAASGLLLVVTIGLSVLDEPWLLLGLAFYAATLVLALFVQRPSLRALIGVRATWDDRAWQNSARRLRYGSYVMATLIGVIGWLMSAKPELW